MNAEQGDISAAPAILTSDAVGNRGNRNSGFAALFGAPAVGDSIVDYATDCRFETLISGCSQPRVNTTFDHFKFSWRERRVQSIVFCHGLDVVFRNDEQGLPLFCPHGNLAVFVQDRLESLGV